MKWPWQSFIFFFFVITFLISAPLVVLYTAGYRYEFTTHTVVKTGVISVSTYPRGATLLIDGTPHASPTPVVADTILPGQHLITLQKAGYTPWSKKLEVFSQSTTFVENVVLFYDDAVEWRSNASEQPSDPTVITETLFDGKRVRIDHLQDRAVLSFVDRAGISTIIAYLPSGTYTFEPAPDDVLLLVDHTKERLIVVNPNNDQPILLNVTGTVFAWQTDRSRLLFTDGFDIQIYDVPSHTQETLTRLSERIIELAWYPQGEVVLYATASHVVALERDRRGTQNRVELAVLDRLDGFELDEKGDVLLIKGMHKNQEGIFTRRLQK